MNATVRIGNVTKRYGRITAVTDVSFDLGEGEIRAALDRNLCRCGAHNRIVRAVQTAAQAARDG